jgi:hypothetical protein
MPVLRQAASAPLARDLPAHSGGHIVDQGDWRALDALVSRVYGKPKETVAVEREESPLDRRLREMSTEELEAIVQRGRHLRAVNESNEEAV